MSMASASPLKSVASIDLQGSDGVAFFENKTGKEYNGPKLFRSKQTAYDLPKDRPYESYELLEEESPEAIIYKVELAKLFLKRYHPQVLEREPDVLFRLGTFPEGYRLFRLTVATKPKDAKKLQLSNTYHVFGHPKGPSHVFTNPAQFVTHLHWLGLNPAKKPSNCPCMLCSPPPPAAPAKKELEAAPPAQQKKNGAKTQSTLNFPTKQPAPQVAIIPPPTPQLSQQNMHFKAQREMDQEGTALFRAGEIVWVENGPNWALSVILASLSAPNNQNIYRLQKFTYPTDQTIPSSFIVGNITENRIRPWVSWTAPPCNVPELNQRDGKNLSLIPWNNYLNHGALILSLDASLLACKRAEKSYTPIDAVHSVGQPTKYYGVYFGAEKLWAGDMLLFRLDSEYPNQYLHVSYFREDYVDNAPAFLAVGNVYKLVTTTKAGPDLCPVSLPSRFRKDLYVRNHFFSLARHPSRTVELVKKNVSVDILKHIKTRWYDLKLVEYMKTMAVIEQEARNNQFSEVITNQMGTSSTAPWEKVTRRVDVFGETIRGEELSAIDRPHRATNTPTQPIPAPVISQRKPLPTEATIIQVQPGQQTIQQQQHQHQQQQHQHQHQQHQLQHQQHQQQHQQQQLQQQQAIQAAQMKRPGKRSRDDGTPTGITNQLLTHSANNANTANSNTNQQPNDQSYFVDDDLLNLHTAFQGASDQDFDPGFFNLP